MTGDRSVLVRLLEILGEIQNYIYILHILALQYTPVGRSPCGRSLCRRPVAQSERCRAESHILEQPAAQQRSAKASEREWKAYSCCRTASKWEIRRYGGYLKQARRLINLSWSITISLLLSSLRLQMVATTCSPNEYSFHNNELQEKELKWDMPCGSNTFWTYLWIYYIQY